MLTVLPHVLNLALFIFGSCQEWITGPHWKWWLWQWRLHGSLPHLLCTTHHASGIPRKWWSSSIISLHRWASALWPHSAILLFQFVLGPICLFILTWCSWSGKVGISSGKINLILFSFCKALEHLNLLFSGQIFYTSWCCHSWEFFKPTDTIRWLE